MRDQMKKEGESIRDLIAYTGITLLLILAMLFYKERTVFIDTSFYIFQLVKTGDFSVFHMRIGSFFGQIPAYIALKMHCDLSTISFWFSTGFMLIHVAIYVSLWQYFKEKYLALTILFTLTLASSKIFFWIASELQFAISFCVFIFAMINYQEKSKAEKYQSYTLMPLLFFILLFFHPSIIFVSSFCFVYYIINRSDSRMMYFRYFIAFTTMFALKWAFLKDPYDTSSFSSVHSMMNNFKVFFELDSTRNLSKYIISDYYVAVLLFIAVLTFLTYQKKFANTFLLLTSVIGMTIIININYPQGGEQFYMENQYNIVAFFICFMFANEVLPSFSTRWQAILLTIMIIWGCFKIFKEHLFLNDRLDWYRNTFKLDKKLVIDRSQIPMDTLLMTWCASYESWQLSTMELGETKSLILEETEGEFSWALSKNKDLIFKFGSNPYFELDPKYFILNDTSYYERIK